LAALDGLRGIAILVVLWYHYWMLAPIVPAVVIAGHRLSLEIVAQTGWIGVNLFFFISGFVIFYPYARFLVDGSPEAPLTTFFIKRMFKIVPSYYLSMIVLVAIGFTQLTLPSAVRQVAVHALFLHPFSPSTFYALNGVTWSLGVEVQFYVLFACLWGGIRRAPWAAFATLAGIGIAYRTIVATSTHGAQAGFLLDQLPAYLDIFAAGMACAYAYRSIDARMPSLARRRSVWTAAAVGALGAGYALLFLVAEVNARSPVVEFVGSQSLEAVVFLVLTLGSLFAFSGWVSALANPALLWLAAISYNLYLWHQAVGVEIARFVGGRSQIVPPALYLPFLGASIALSLLIAMATTAWIERPLLEVGRRFARRVAERARLARPKPIEAAVR
jgi:peptidoglycan/LPS O-acetylase OafA/YrhL